MQLMQIIKTIRKALELPAELSVSHGHPIVITHYNTAQHRSRNKTNLVISVVDYKIIMKLNYSLHLALPRICVVRRFSENAGRHRTGLWHVLNVPGDRITTFTGMLRHL